MRKTVPYPQRNKTPLPLPRPLAVDILVRVEMDGAFAEPLLDQYLSDGRISLEPDRRLLTELVYGTLRMQGCLDWLLERFCQGGLRRLEPAVRAILRTALYQYFFTERIPDFAIVNEAVELTKAESPRRAAFVNAILRNIIRSHETMPAPDDSKDPAQDLAVLHAHPPWLVKKWLQRLGPEETVELCRANNHAPPLCLRVNGLHASRETVIQELADAGFFVQKTVYSPDGLIWSDAIRNLRETAPYQKGWLQVQDEASQLIARLVAPAKGDRVLDLCAGVGGKATHLAEIMQNAGRIVAVDIRPEKIEALKVLMQRLGSTIIKPLVADAREDLGRSIGRSFDRVLLDVPCSGTGILRRAPEIKWRLSAREMKATTALQKQLLLQAACCVKEGGRLVYSTCSVLEEENAAVVNAFLGSRKDFALEKPGDIDPCLLDRQGCFRSFPHRHGMDGFFGAVMIRRHKTFPGRRPPP